MTGDYSKLKDKLHMFKDNMIQSKKYWLIYLIMIAVISLTLLTLENYQHPKTELITILLVSIFGVFIIVFHCVHNDERQLHKTAFIIIIVFGVLCCLMNPILIGPDEPEHFIRSEITSQGIIMPEYENGSYETIQSIIELKLYKNENALVDNGTVFTNNYDDRPINYSTYTNPSAFAQNPFYGYLPQAIGISVAKLLDLNAIWLLWLGRICNLICYAALVSYAIRKTPVLKMPILVVSCIPLCIYQGASLSIDSIINGMTILLIAFFLHMYKSPHDSITKRDMIVFAIIALLLGLCKLTSFMLVFLILLVPKSNFSDKNYYYGIASILLLGIIGIIWAKFFMLPGLNSSFRLEYSIANNINSTAQIGYIMSHKGEALIGLLSILKYVPADLLNLGYRFSPNYPFNDIYLLFLGLVLLSYPIDRFDFKTRIGALAIFASNYVLVHIVQLLTWTPVGEILNIQGVQSRYFLPLFALVPIIFGFNHMESDREDINNYILILTIGFLASLIIWIASCYY